MGMTYMETVSGLFLDMLEISVLSGVGILIVLAVSPLLKKKHTVFWRYVLWIILAIRLVFPFDISISGKAFVLPWQNHVQNGRQEEFSFIEDSGKNNRFGAEEERDKDSKETVFANGNERKEQKEAGTENKSYRRVEGEDNNPNFFPDAKSPEFRTVWTKFFLNLLPFFWAAGVLAFLLWQAAAYGIFFHRVKKTKVFLMEKENTPVYICSAALAPVLMGIKKPQILLPCGEYEGERLQFILDHELAHLKRKDLWAKLLFSLARTLHWFNPLVFLLERRAALDMEFLCDSHVVKNFTRDEKKKYSETLLSFAALKNRKAALLFTSEFSRDAKSLKERFANIFSDGKKKKGILAAGTGICILLSASLFLAPRPSGKENFTGKGDVLRTEEAKEAKETEDIKEGGRAWEKESLKEKLSRLEGMSLEEAAASAYGAVFPRLIYASERRAILYDYWGLLIYDISNQKIELVLDLKAAGLCYIQGEKVTHIEVSEDGEQILLYNEPGGEEKFVYYIKEKRLEYSDLKTFGENRYDGLFERTESNYAQTEEGKLAYLSADSLVKKDGEPFHEEDMKGLSLVVLREDEGDARIYPLFEEVYEKNGEQAITHLKFSDFRKIAGRKYLYKDEDGWAYYLEEDVQKESPLQEIAGAADPLLLTRYKEGERQVLEDLIYQYTWLECPVIFTEGRIVYKAAKTADVMGIKDPGLVSIAMDGSDRRTADHIMYNVFDGICEDGGWIYYSGWTNDSEFPKPLCRIAPDFSEEPEFVEELPGFLCGVMDGFVYYLAADGKKPGIWKRNLLTGEETIHDKWGIMAEEITLLNAREVENISDIIGEPGGEQISGCQIMFSGDFEDGIHSMIIPFY